jgi:glyoxylase-like metal-dependent hydrolase (beta-lactamase superfamily II)
LALDAGSSAAHARSFLEGLEAEGVAPPSLVVLTHSHWDHVLGAAELGIPVVAHARTAEYLNDLALLDWSDDALDARLAAGAVTQFHVDNVKQELPSPRDVTVAPADIVFSDSLTFELGSVTVRAQFVANDHTDDGCVMFVEPDRVLFVGDATCESPAGALTTGLALPLLDVLLGFDAEHVVEGHNDAVLTRAQFEELAATIRGAGMLVERLGPGEDAILAEVGDAAHEDAADIVRAFVAGASR